MASRYLILQDGTFYKGKAFGGKALTYEELMQLDEIDCFSGEAVFNTSMCAYSEILSDNSYAGQMVVMTNPHIGTYGCDPHWFQHMTKKPQMRGFIVKKLYTGPIFQNRISLDQVCQNFGIPGITAVDTRGLTIHLRDKGAMYGILIDEENLQALKISIIQSKLEKIPPMEYFDMITPSLHSDKIEVLGDPNSPISIALVDYGLKKGILEELLVRGAKVSIIPSPLFLQLDTIEFSLYNFLFLSNGPGDPRSLNEHVKKVASLLNSIEVRGICLGHQIISLALGIEVEKLIFGHHGSNHPVLNELDKSIIITSQNHNYSVVRKNLKPSTTVWFTNLNDGSVEGIIDTEHKVMCTQFHPEGRGGSHDALSLFDTFLQKRGQICQK